MAVIGDGRCHFATTGSNSLERTFLTLFLLPSPTDCGGEEADLPEGEPHPEAAAPLTIPWAVLKQSGSGIRSSRRFNFSENAGSFPRCPRKRAAIRITIPGGERDVNWKRIIPPSSPPPPLHHLDEPSRFPPQLAWQ